MTRKSHIDLIGAVALTLFSLNLGFNQVVIKVANGGFQPVFMAGLRSLGALVLLGLWMWARGISLRMPIEGRMGGIIAGLLFAIEFICLFLALDLTSVARTSILFYSMPVWLALSAHLLIPGERLTGVRLLGLVRTIACLALLSGPVVAQEASSPSTGVTDDSAKAAGYRKVILAKLNHSRTYGPVVLFKFQN